MTREERITDKKKYSGATPKQESNGKGFEFIQAGGQRRAAPESHEWTWPSDLGRKGHLKGFWVMGTMKDRKISSKCRLPGWLSG